SSAPIVVRLYYLAQGDTFDNFQAVVEGSIVPKRTASKLAKVPESRSATFPPIDSEASVRREASDSSSPAPAAREVHFPLLVMTDSDRPLVGLGTGNLPQGCRCRIMISDDFGWNVYIEANDRVVSITHCSDWHRVER